MRICFWSTSFQADNQALASYLSRQPGVEVVVALDEPERYRQEPVWAVLPYRGRLLDRRAADTPAAILAFGPDCMIADNHLPKRRLAPRLYVLWHGYGWRVDDLSTMKRELVKLVGAVERPNPSFRWHAFGPEDRRYRTQRSGFAEENVVLGGSTYSDLLIPEAPDAVRLEPSSVQEHYRIDLRRPTVLLGMTWHHGGALAHWGNDQALHEALCEHLARANANLLIRMHDRHRYERADVQRMETLAARYPNVQLKFKSSSPDSLVDVLVSSLMISNYSSFLNAFYHTRKPTIHIDPSARDGRPNYRRELLWGKLRVKKVEDPLATWKLPASEVGGLIARDFDELLAAVDLSLAQPSCCADLAREFNQRHVSAADGRTCERVADYLSAWVNR